MPNAFSKCIDTQFSSAPYMPPNMGFEYNTDENLNDFLLDCIESRAYSLECDERDDYMIEIINENQNLLKQECLQYLEYFIDGHKTFINALMNTIDFKKLASEFKYMFEADIEALLKPDDEPVVEVNGQRYVELKNTLMA